MPRTPLLVVAHRGDPLLAEIARTIHELFPQCLHCGRVIDRADDADVRLFRNRLVHRHGCPVTDPLPRRGGGGALAR